MATTSTVSPSPDHNAPLATVSDNDHGAWVLICNAFGLSVILITLLIRIYIRVKVSPPFGADDYTLAGATALAIVQIAVVFSQVDTGFGRSIDLLDASQTVRVQELGFAADILFIVALYASKCCVTLFFQRISPSKASAIFAWTVSSLCLASTVASIFAVSLKCDLSKPWLWYERTCSGHSERWRAVAALDIITEVLLFAMSLHLVWDLQTSIIRKTKVIFAFALRLFVILIAGIRLQHIERQIASPNPTLIGATAGVMTQLELFYSLVAATIPCLRPFLAAFVTNYGAMGGDTIMHGSHIGASRTKDSKASKGSSFALRSMDSAKRAMRRHERGTMHSAVDHDPASGSSEILRPDSVANRASAGPGKNPRGAPYAASGGSDGSTKGMVIKKEVAWQIDSESTRTRSISEGQT